jgi:anti-sigma B factor antagonist
MNLFSPLSAARRNCTALRYPANLQARAARHPADGLGPRETVAGKLAAMASTDEAALSVELIPGAVSVVRARGELELATAARLCAVTDMAAVRARGVPRVVIDLTGVSFCDSTGLRALLGAVREVEVLGGAVMVALVPDSAPARLLELSGLREFVPVADSAEAARRRLGSPASA